MAYIPIQGFRKGYIPIQGFEQLPQSMSQSTVSIAPQTEGIGIWSGIKNVVSGLYEKVRGVAEKTSLIQDIAKSKSVGEFLSQPRPFIGTGIIPEEIDRITQARISGGIEAAQAEANKIVMEKVGTTALGSIGFMEKVNPNVVKQLAKFIKPQEIAPILRELGVSEDLITPAAEKLSTISKESEVKNALESLAKIQETTKVSPFLEAAKGITPLQEGGRMTAERAKAPSQSFDERVKGQGGEDIAKQLGVKIKVGEGGRGGLAHFNKTDNSFEIVCMRG